MSPPYPNPVFHFFLAGYSLFPGWPDQIQNMLGISLSLHGLVSLSGVWASSLTNRNEPEEDFQQQHNNQHCLVNVPKPSLTYSPRLCNRQSITPSTGQFRVFTFGGFAHFKCSYKIWPCKITSHGLCYWSPALNVLLNSNSGGVCIPWIQASGFRNGLKICWRRFLHIFEIAYPA